MAESVFCDPARIGLVALAADDAHGILYAKPTVNPDEKPLLTQVFTHADGVLSRGLATEYGIVLVQLAPSNLPDP